MVLTRGGLAPRMQRERAELEQNFAREIGNLVQRLSAEKAELEAELRLKMDQEVMAVRWVATSLEMRQAYWPAADVERVAQHRQEVLTVAFSSTHCEHCQQGRGGASRHAPGAAAP